MREGGVGGFFGGGIGVEWKLANLDFSFQKAVDALARSRAAGLGFSREQKGRISLCFVREDTHQAAHAQYITST